MSWDASLTYGTMSRDWNYTHNCNSMIRRVLDALRIDYRHDESSPWWSVLDGITADEAQSTLDAIVGGLAEAPTLFRSMNPPNGWGDYDSLMSVLIDMRDTARACPAAVWDVSG